MCACYRLPIPISSPVPRGGCWPVPTAQSLAAVLERVQANEHPPDLIRHRGSSQDHSPESHQRFASMMAPPARPIYWLPGNHDDGP